MIRRSPLGAALAAAAIGLVACAVEGPTNVVPQPSIVIELPADADSLLSILNEAHFYITPPEGMTRDTLLRFEPAAGPQRVRVLLRPDETVAGTVIDLELKDFGIVLFTGSIELTAGEEWALTLVIPVEPNLSLTVEPVVVVNAGASRLLSDLAQVRYANGTIAPGRTITWSSSNPEAAVFSGDRVTFPISGSVALVAQWEAQMDTIPVIIR